MKDWRVDGAQLSRLLFAALESCLAKRQHRGVERPLGDHHEGLTTLLGREGTGPPLWARMVEPEVLVRFAADVRNRLGRPEDLAKLLAACARDTLGLPEGLFAVDDLRRHDVDWHFPLISYLFQRGGPRMLLLDGDQAGPAQSSRADARAALAEATERWTDLRRELMVPPPPPPPSVGPNTPPPVAVLPHAALEALFPSAEDAHDDADPDAADGGIGRLARVADDTNALLATLAELESEEWRNERLWDASRTAVAHKAWSEISRRARMVPGPKFKGTVAAL